MPRLPVVFGEECVEVDLPDGTECLAVSHPLPIAAPRDAVAQALRNPVRSPGLETMARRAIEDKGDPAVAIVISDNTRPVPYRGESGILAPVVDVLVDAGVSPQSITVIVATGTHRKLSERELETMIDPSVLARPVRVVCHDCRDRANLVPLGTTSRGTTVLVNRLYLDADVKIVTGLVESHFMAGASGGRKSICPGLLGEEGTHVFHGPEILSSPNVGDLILAGNPCHEEALEIARMAGVDFIVNVTLNHEFQLTGVFAGHLEAAHEAAVARLREHVAIPVDREYDIVVTHAGFVGINHYQAAKAAVVALPALRPGGHLVMAARNVDQDPVGSQRYRTVLHLLTMNGPNSFMRLIRSREWRFIPEQWQVQMWCKVFGRIPVEHFTYCAPHISAADSAVLPGRDGNLLLSPERRHSRFLGDAAEMVRLAVNEAVDACSIDGTKPSIAFLRDGPYGILVRD